MIKRLSHHVRTCLLQLGRLIIGGDWYARTIGVRIGNGCRLYSSRFGTEPFLISIGDNVTITSGVSFITHDGSTCLISDDKGRRYTYGRINIGNNVFIGLNSIIMPGVHIGDNVVIGAGSLVNKSVPSNTVVAGVPIKRIGSFDEYRERALGDLKSAAELDRCRTYKERVLLALAPASKPFID